MNNYFSLALLIVSTFFTQLTSHGQENQGKPEHRIIFQLTSSDTNTHKQLVKQLNNILIASPSSKLEVVCHGMGIEFLLNDKSIVKDKVKDLREKGIEFVACEFTMKEKKIEKEKLFPFTETVKAGILEIVKKQELGWSYIKAGN